MKALVAAIALIAAGCGVEASSLVVMIEPEAAELRGGNIMYQAGGAFTVHVEAVTDAADVDTSLQALAAELTVADDRGAMSATGKVSLVRSASNPHVFLGTAMLGWPAGGAVTVTARVAGVEAAQRLTIATPEVALVVARAQPVPGTRSADVAFCVVSSARDGSVVLHLERATFTGTAEVDRTAALVRGPCAIAGADVAIPAPAELVIESHAALSLTTRSETPAISAALPAPTAGAAALAMITAQAIAVVVPPPVASLTFVSIPIAARAGTVITAQVEATTGPGGTGRGIKGVTVSFVASASLTFIPPTAATDDQGFATTMFVMPELRGGSLIVGATGAELLTSATIAAAP